MVPVMMAVMAPMMVMMAMMMTVIAPVTDGVRRDDGHGLDGGDAYRNYAYSGRHDSHDRNLDRDIPSVPSLERQRQEELFQRWQPLPASRER